MDLIEGIGEIDSIVVLDDIDIVLNGEIDDIFNGNFNLVEDLLLFLSNLESI